MGKRYVIVAVEDGKHLSLAPGIETTAAIEERDLDLIKSALWQATDLWWDASRDQAAALSDSEEDREAALHSLKCAKQGESVMRKLGHKWLPEHFDSQDEFHKAMKERSIRLQAQADRSEMRMTNAADPEAVADYLRNSKPVCGYAGDPVCEPPNCSGACNQNKPDTRPSRPNQQEAWNVLNEER